MFPARNSSTLEKPRARDPLRRWRVTLCAVFRLPLCADNKMTPAGAIPAGDFFVVLDSVLAGGKTKTTRKHDKGKKHSPLPCNGDGDKKYQQCFSYLPKHRAQVRAALPGKRSFYGKVAIHVRGASSRDVLCQPAARLQTVTTAVRTRGVIAGVFP